MAVSFLHIPRKGMGMAAFSRELICPFCEGKKWKFVEKISEYRFRYQCKLCKRTVQYDTSNRPEHPYEPFNKSNRFQDLLAKIKRSV